MTADFAPPRPPIRARSLVDGVVQTIGQEIMSGAFRPGDSLPNETEWCERLGVSRSVLREGLRVLVSKNLIDIRARTGGRVREMAAWDMLDRDILAWRAQSSAGGGDQRDFAAELFELRRVVEPAAANLAAVRISPAQLAELRRAYDAMEAAGEDVARFIEPDRAFHRIIGMAVGNSLFGSLAEVVTGALDLTLRMALQAPRGQAQSLPLHREVLDAIAARDGAAAESAMRRLLAESERDVAEAIAARRPGRTPRGPARKASAAIRRKA